MHRALHSVIRSGVATASPMPTRLGSYDILAEVKSGGMATLYLGRRSGPAGFSRTVAIKVLKSHLAHNTQFIKMFIDEARIASRIAHPNVVHIEELGEADGEYFLVMEYVHGASLSELLTKVSMLQRRLRAKAATALMMAAAAGLHAAHETRDESGNLLNVVHRDVSPQNILVGAKGEVKIIDFGIAKARNRLHVTDAGSGLKGKLRYMAPEQLERSQVDRRTDVYALGVVLWEVLAMRRLFHGASDPEVINRILKGQLPPPGAFADVPFELDAVVMRALSKDPDRRPQTARAFRQELKKAVPAAAGVDPVEIAALLTAVLGGELAEREERLLGRASMMSTTELDVLPAQALQELTAPLDDEVETATEIAMTPMSDREVAVPTLIKQSGELAAPPAPVPAPARMSLPPTPAPVAPVPAASAGGIDLKTILLVIGGLLLGAAIAGGAIYFLRSSPEPEPFLEPVGCAPGQEPGFERGHEPGLRSGSGEVARATLAASCVTCVRSPSSPSPSSPAVPADPRPSSSSRI